MTGLIGSSATLDMMSAHAPRSWCKRVLLWGIQNQSILPWCSSGKIVETVSKYEWEADRRKDEGLDGAALIEAIKNEIGLDAAFGDEIPIETNEWAEEPRWMPVAPFIFADELDWELGRLKGSLYFDDETRPFFHDSEEFNSVRSSRDAKFHFDLSGLCFEFDVIELLAPGGDWKNIRSSAASPSGPRVDVSKRSGRPPKWDWEGAIAHIVAVANTPDGLPTGSGAQAHVARLMADWFAQETGEAPAESEVRKRAATILNAVTRR